jgi:transposase-like protein
VAVRWYLRYGLSYRDVEELLAERGIVVDHVTVYRWGAAVYSAADRRGPTLPACARWSVVCR